MKFVDYDPFYGLTTYYKREGDKGILSEVQDVEPFISMNKQIGTNIDKKKNIWWIGELPLSICHLWSTECGAKMFSPEWHAYARKKLNDPDYRMFNQGKIKLK